VLERAALVGDESEKHFMARVRRGAEVLGWVVFHHLDSMGTRGGFPDLFMVRPPRVVLAELKSEHGRLSAAQRAVLELLRRCPGVEAYTWRPSDEPAIWRILSGGPPAISVELER
jgi:hypothetical protein